MRKSDSNDQDRLTDEEIVHNLNSFFVAGHDTTANSLACEMYHLAKNPNIQEKLRKEVFTTLKIESNASKLAIPTIDQIKEMEYLELFIKEAMRINPPVAEISRVLNDNYIIPGDHVVLPKGLRVSVSIYGIHHDPKIYKNPEEFNPERFLNGKYDTDVYMPFGGGSRMCIGSNFSLIEQKVFLIMLLQKFKVDIKPENADFEKLRIRGTVHTKPEDLNLNFVPVF
ncbi:cytochrome P450 [Conidiobolus coronatus NRRL 28638]|uniref:Cytochrome P450 n=1 Tax=Conidiobolus coronatus (strain ATCC 28846 / CBS 209.66 / NRRL 28638) TaxID=796925 RepID=A0A137PIV9_CONC2|nr:cytochrome P450 [Conidiobolus coronatus NRRL 28638]|eukprot:KXN74927.1 cytochrome P450 [Conidiobolus coronatus NRRL 28638]